VDERTSGEKSLKYSPTNCRGRKAGVGEGWWARRVLGGDKREKGMGGRRLRSTRPSALVKIQTEGRLVKSRKKRTVRKNLGREDRER